MNKSRIELEKKILCRMIFIYCKGNKHGEVPCSQCKELLDYANQRLSLCKFGENKTFCSRCTVHCFKPEMREVVRNVMKYSGPRILFYNPIMTMKHFLQK